MHVLSTPPAFVLSQDQTLREIYFYREPVYDYFVAAEYTSTAAVMTRYFNF